MCHKPAVHRVMLQLPMGLKPREEGQGGGEGGKEEHRGGASSCFCHSPVIRRSCTRQEGWKLDVHGTQRVSLSTCLRGGPSCCE